MDKTIFEIATRITAKRLTEGLEKFNAVMSAKKDVHIVGVVPPSLDAYQKVAQMNECKH